MSDYFGKDVFKLGFGMMRLPKNADGSIDIPQTCKMVDMFLEGGGTYFDTAYVYDGGGSEKAIKEALVDRHPRESFTLATKLNASPGVCQDEESAKQQFYTSLERTGAGYFDYYLLHALQYENIDNYNKYGLWDFGRELKEKGLIRYFGFSFHSTPEHLDELLTAHPEVDFIQLQINYADMENANVCSRACYEVARKHGKSIVVMELVKGGTLANPPQRVADILKEANPEASCASWAIRFVASMDGILTVLSGMSNIEQMEDNMSYMKDFKPLTDKEQETIQKALEALNSVRTFPCTACRYCTPGCPMNINIPGVFSAMNTLFLFGDKKKADWQYNDAVRGHGKASECIQCGQCESACPQHLPIISYLEESAENLE